MIYSNTVTNGTFINSLPYGNIPILTHVHEMDYVIECFGKENIKEVKRQSVHFIACSKAAAAGLTQIQGISAKKISIVPEAISPSDIIRQSQSLASFQIRKSLGLGRADFLVVGCGTMDLRKGIDLFIQLAEYCIRKMHGKMRLKFLWIGSIPEDPVADILKRDARKLKSRRNLYFLGERLNLYPYFAASNLFCLTSREDPFPLVMLEAGALGKATLAFERSGGAEEYCRRGGGFLIPYLDVAGMGDWILEHFMDKKFMSEAGRKAQKLVQDNYNMKITGPQYVRLIERFSRKDAAPTAGISQLFVPEIGGYSEEASIRKPVAASQWNKISFGFRARGSHNSWRLRFDPMDRISVIEISKITLKSNNGRILWKADSGSDFNAVRVEGDAIRLPDENVLKLLSLGPDPILYLPKTAVKEREQKFKLELRLRADASREAFASNCRPLIQAFREYDAIYGYAKKAHTQPSGGADNVEKLEIELLYAGISKKSRITYIWGTGSAGRQIAEAIIRCGYDFQGFIDRDREKQGRRMMERPIFAPAVLERKTKKTRPFIIIGSQFHAQIARRLKRMGYDQGIDYAASPLV